MICHIKSRVIRRGSAEFGECIDLENIGQRNRDPGEIGGILTVFLFSVNFHQSRLASALRLRLGLGLFVRTKMPLD